MFSKKDIVIFVLIAGLVISIIFNFKDKQTFVPFDDKPLRDSIALQQQIIDMQKEVFGTYTLKRDTVHIIETGVKNYYNEIYTFNRTASNYQADSVIRANW